MYSGYSLRRQMPKWCYCMSLRQSWMLPILGNLSVTRLELWFLRFRMAFGPWYPRKRFAKPYHYRRKDRIVYPGGCSCHQGRARLLSGTLSSRDGLTPIYISDLRS
jgi:hypothetical protein